jgi:hypothetical protein
VYSFILIVKINTKNPQIKICGSKVINNFYCAIDNKFKNSSGVITFINSKICF